MKCLAAAKSPVEHMLFYFQSEYEVTSLLFIYHFLHSGSACLVMKLKSHNETNVANRNITQGIRGNRGSCATFFFYGLRHASLKC